MIRALYEWAETGCTVWVRRQKQDDKEIVIKTEKSIPRALNSLHSP